jgi:hypothetical protein
MASSWLLGAVCVSGLGSLPVFLAWRVAVERYLVPLREHHPAYRDQAMKQAPRPWGDYRSLLFLARAPAPDAAGEAFRLRARALRRLANGCLYRAGVVMALLALWDGVTVGWCG